MADPLLPTRLEPAPAPVPPARVGAAPAAPLVVAPPSDRLALSRASAAPPTFGWSRALGRLWIGVKAQAHDTWRGMVEHPWLTLGGIAGFAGLTLAAGYVGISPVAVGHFSIALFGGLASFRLGRAVVHAVADWRRGDVTKAEADFEEIGRGTFDVAITVGPAVAGKAISVLRRSEAGAALNVAFKESPAGKAFAGVQALPGRAWQFVRTSKLGKLTLGEGEGGRLAAIAERLRAGLGGPRLAATKARLDAWRLAIAESGTVRGFNFVFETLPARFEGWLITRINYSRPAIATRNWAIEKIATYRGDPNPTDAAKNFEAARQILAAPGQPLERFARISDKLYRGSAPLNDAHFAELQAKNVKTIVSLLHPENPKEIGMLAAEKALAAKYGIEVVNVPLPFGVDPPPEMIATFLNAVDRSPGAAYVHCRLGRDRTGAMVAVYRMARQGQSHLQAYAEMQQYGFDPKKETYLQYLADFVNHFGEGLKSRVQHLFLRGTMQDAGRTIRNAAPAIAPRVGFEAEG